MDCQVKCVNRLQNIAAHNCVPFYEAYQMIEQNKRAISSGGKMTIKTATKAYQKEAPSDRIFSILECITRHNSSLSVSDISDELKLPVPTVHRIVIQLISNGFLKRALNSKRILAGPRLTDFGIRAAAAGFISDFPHTILTTLSEELNEHCQIGIMSEGKIVYVDAVSPSRATGLKFFPGSTAPLHCSSIGKVFLSQYSKKDLKSIIQTLYLERFTETTICSPEELFREIMEVKKNGWARNNREFSIGVIGCAVPIFNANRRLIAGLGASVPDAYVSYTDIEKLIPILKIAADKISNYFKVG